MTPIIKILKSKGTDLLNSFCCSTFWLMRGKRLYTKKTLYTKSRYKQKPVTEWVPLVSALNVTGRGRGQLGNKADSKRQWRQQRESDPRTLITWLSKWTGTGNLLCFLSERCSTSSCEVLTFPAKEQDHPIFLRGISPVSWDGEAGRVIAYKVGGGGDECLALRKNVKNVKELVVPPYFHISESCRKGSSEELGTGSIHAIAPGIPFKIIPLSVETSSLSGIGQRCPAWLLAGHIHLHHGPGAMTHKL